MTLSLFISISTPPIISTTSRTLFLPLPVKYILISSHVKDWLHSALFVVFLFRACVSPSRWDTSGFTACDSSVYSADSFHNPSRSSVHGSDMDSEHS